MGESFYGEGGQVWAELALTEEKSQGGQMPLFATPPPPPNEAPDVHVHVHVHVYLHDNLDGLEILTNLYCTHFKIYTCLLQTTCTCTCRDLHYPTDLWSGS